MDLVPPERRSQRIPCHHIPLTPAGETVHTLERCERRDAMEDTVKNWLRGMIKLLEDVRAEQVTRATRLNPRRSVEAANSITWGKVAMGTVIVVREWDCDTFHRRVLELEAQGYVARRDGYSITPEMNPDTGEIIHLYTIELQKPAPDTT